MTLGILWIAALLYAAILLGYEVTIGRKQLKAAILQAKCERNRDRFGELRTELMRLAREGEVDVKSEAFAVLFRSLTALMGSPSDYPGAVSALLRFSMKPGKGAAFSVTPREGRLLMEFAERLDLLCRDFDGVYRFIARHLDLRHDGTQKGEIPVLIRFWLTTSRRKEQRRQFEE